VALAGYGAHVWLGLGAAIMTHGIVEIPIVVLAAAAALRLGAVVTRLPPGMTVGHAWITALGDTLKIAVGVVIPGLVLAALLEAYITPQVFLAVAGR